MSTHIADSSLSTSMASTSCCVKDIKLTCLFNYNQVFFIISRSESFQLKYVHTEQSIDLIKTCMPQLTSPLAPVLILPSCNSSIDYFESWIPSLYQHLMQFCYLFNWIMNCDLIISKQYSISGTSMTKCNAFFIWLMTNSVLFITRPMEYKNSCSYNSHT